MKTIVAALAAALFLGWAGAVGAATEPADSAIAGAVMDLDRFEEQVRSMTPSSGAGIKRVSRLLELTEERLLGSANQDHASWIEANERLTRLKQALADLAAGKMPGDTPPVEAAPAPASTADTAAADPVVAAALAEIDRLTPLIADTGPDDRALIKRHRLQLNQVADRLNGVLDKSTADFARAAEGYNAANSALNALIEQANAAAGATAPGSGGTASDGDGPAPQVERAGRELDMIARQVESMRGDDRRLAERFFNDLARIEQELAAVPDKSHSAWAQTDGRRSALRDSLVTKVANGAQPALQGIIDRINSLQPLQYLIAGDVASVRGQLSDLQNYLTALSSPDNPAVQQLLLETERVSGAYEERVAAAEAEHAKLGDVWGRLQTISKRNSETQVPSPLQGPLGEEDIATFLQRAIAVQSLTRDELPYLQQVNGNTPMTVDQSNAFRRLLYEVGDEKPRGLQNAIQVSTANLDLWVDQDIQLIDFVAETDPSDFNHRASRLVGKGAYEQLATRLEQTREAVRVTALFDRGIARQGGPDRAAQAEAVEGALASLAEKRRIALDTIRLPEPASDDPKLLEVVEQVLGEAGHGFERAVVSTDVRKLEKETGDFEAESVSGDKISGTMTVYRYAWEEFQAVTAEREGELVYLWANEFRFYTAGSETTPLNRWILSDRFQTMQILEENVHKP